MQNNGCSSCGKPCPEHLVAIGEHCDFICKDCLKMVKDVQEDDDANKHEAG